MIAKPKNYPFKSYDEARDHLLSLGFLYDSEVECFISIDIDDAALIWKDSFSDNYGVTFGVY